MTNKEFYAKWMENFAGDVSKEDIEKYVVSTGNYIWHIFSWELLEKNQYLIGNKAKKAYNKIDKTGAIYMDWFNDEPPKDLIPDLNTAKALDDYTEVYVVGKNFEWTYIKTHEGMCGPYFMKRKL